MERGFQKSHSGKHVLSTGADLVVILKNFTDSEREGPGHDVFHNNKMNPGRQNKCVQILQKMVLF